MRRGRSNLGQSETDPFIVLIILIIAPLMVFTLQVKNLAVAKEMVVSMAVEAKVRFLKNILII